MTDSVDTCINGWGVTCASEVRVRPDCTVVVEAGTIIFPDGKVRHHEEKHFRYYLKPEFISAELMKFMFAFLKIDKLNRQHMEFLLLVEAQSTEGKTDPLKQQHPEDVPEENLMWNKVAAVVSLGDELFWLLVSLNAIAKSKGMTDQGINDSQDLFLNVVASQEVDIISIDTFLRPILKMPVLVVPRFGYRELALIKPSDGLSDANIHNPFDSVNTFKQVFFEYKIIIDEYLPHVRNAIKTLHEHFGPVLSHKGEAYLENCRKWLSLKVKMFYEEGEHLYYIQYIYDWLRDLTTAINELVTELEAFKPGCACVRGKEEDDQQASIVLLGPVLGAMSSYQPPVFRNLARPGDNERIVRKIRCMHWRLMMMIRTFDLPLLHLEKVISDDDGIEERLDSTDYWEFVNSEADNKADNEFNWLPIKCTPTRGVCSLLGKRAIPYYYPLDSNSIYSVHQYWDYEYTLLRRCDWHLSYNAYAGDDEKPPTDVVNDSYTNRIEVILPLAFDIEPYPFLKMEGQIGRHIVAMDGEFQFYFKSFPLLEYLTRYNICVDIIAIGLTGPGHELMMNQMLGLEHRPMFEQGKTIVLLFVDTDTEQIELQECKKDKLPEVDRYTVVADFVLPYRYSCCPVAGLKAYTLTTSQNG